MKQTSSLPQKIARIAFLLVTLVSPVEAIIEGVKAHTLDAAAVAQIAHTLLLQGRRHLPAKRR